MCLNCAAGGRLSASCVQSFEIEIQRLDVGRGSVTVKVKL